MKPELFQPYMIEDDITIVVGTCIKESTVFYRVIWFREMGVHESICF
jgi:hypothetical protein